MSSFFLLFSLCISTIFSAAPEITKLNVNTFDSLIQVHPSVILFYLHNDTASAELRTQFHEAFKECTTLGVSFGEMNCTRAENLCKRGGIKGFPEVRLF
jgi:hypothetical protein